MSIWQFDFIPFWFSKNDLSRETARPCYLWLFSEDMKIFSFNFSYFCHSWGVIDISLLQKKLLTSICNRWCQQLFIFNSLEIGCLIIIFVLVLNYFFLKNGEAGNSDWITWNYCSLISLEWIASLADCSYGKSNN